jgi:cyclophilin family peptidyl-prolyl cis-trans isomerase
MKRLSLFILLCATAFAQAPAAPAASPGAEQPKLEPGLYAILTTSMGKITAQLFEKETPVTVQNFVALARGTKAWMDPVSRTMIRKPLYNNITFHRVIPNFMIQTGDPTATGSHDCGIKIKDEIVPDLKFDRPGRLGMANIGRPNTGGCQFFITEVPYPSLNGGYTVFGQVVEGQDLVGQIARVPRNADDKPRTPVKLLSIVIRREGPPPAPAAPAPAATKKAAPKAAPAAPAK